ncbi:MAG TPA: head GIN domain-containing protein [Allosphingosinicella sp.]|nr:head GIN domain-containing protein [Allosphingosinicella sp.]
MSRIAFLLAAALLAAPAAAAERSYPVTDFDSVRVEGPFEVSLATGRSSHVRATGSADALDRVSVEVEGRTLRIRANASAWGGTPGESPGPIRIDVSTQDLARATLLGSGSLVIDKARGLRLDLALGGNGRLTIGAVDEDNLNVDLLGSGRITLGGHAKQMHAAVKGSGDMAGEGLVADDVQLIADTGGTVTLGGARSAHVVATGPGDVTIGGTPACTVDNKGAGRVRCGR